MVQVKRKDELYYARIIPETRIYEVCDLKVRTIRETWFSAVDKRDKRAYLFNNNDIGEIVFFDRNTALSKVNEAEKFVPGEKCEIDYEEY